MKLASRFLRVSVLLASAPLIAACTVVYPIRVVLRNVSDQPIAALLCYRERVRATDTLPGTYTQWVARGLRYAPALLKPGRKLLAGLSGLLPTTVTDTTVSFVMPPHATILLDATLRVNEAPVPLHRATLTLQRAGYPAQTLDSTQFAQAAHYLPYDHGLLVWYDAH